MSQEVTRAVEQIVAPKIEQLRNRWNNDEFIYGSYNGIEILMRKHDRYINAKKLCMQVGSKEFYRINDNNGWKQFSAELKRLLQIDSLS